MADDPPRGAGGRGRRHRRGARDHPGEERDGGAGPGQVAAPHRRDVPARRAPAQRGVRHGAVVAERGLPRGSAARSARSGRPSSAAADVRAPRRRAPGAGGLADLRPPRRRQRDGRPDDDRARGGVAGARRRPRGARHREHRERPQLPDRPRRRRAEPRQGGDDRAVAPHARRRAALHRVAQPGVDAGDRGGQRQLRRRGTPLRRRCRHRDRGERRHLLRHPRVARAGDVVRRRRALAQDGVRADHAHGVGRSIRADARDARPAAGDDLADRRPARRTARRGAGAGRDRRQELAGCDARHQEGAVGCARARSHRRLPRRRAGARRHVGPPRPDRRSARVLREATGSMGDTVEES